MDEKLSENIRWVSITCIYTMKSLCRSSTHELPWLWLTFAQTSETHEMQSQIALNAKPHGIFVLQLDKTFLYSGFRCRFLLDYILFALHTVFSAPRAWEIRKLAGWTIHGKLPKPNQN